MASPETIPAMHWIIFALAALIAVAAVFHNAIKVLLKLVILGVLLALVIYLLVQNGVITLPSSGK